MGCGYQGISYAQSNSFCPRKVLYTGVIACIWRGEMGVGRSNNPSSKQTTQGSEKNFQSQWLLKGKDKVTNPMGESRYLVMVTSQLSGQLQVEVHHVMGTQRGWGILKVNDNMMGRIHKMFELCRIIGHFTCEDKVWILYLDLDLSHLPSLRRM